ncbi:FGFR1 oncogene partner 2 homolog [Onthophagus taurus]|uniref:FGFR1 oncogene partner 2 homolog n=1 Tax=Onthophagus taurus TaxID=166361 RepID=UPI000C2031FC|nr:FGFR1 oncogene partner 2 homolog [Onthophagus taurus]
MSLTIQQIITDAKRLAGRLKERDSIAEVLLSETHAINKKIDTMKQYQEEVEQLNEVAHQTPHTQLIANIQKENRHLREIQQENRELRAALEEHQTALEHIMSKYRQHTTEQIYKSRVDFSMHQDERSRKIITEQAEKIHEMAAVMDKAALMDEMKFCHDLEIVSRLQAENKGLKEMLEISCKYGSYGQPLVIPDKEDKFVQTDQNK